MQNIKAMQSKLFEVEKDFELSKTLKSDDHKLMAIIEHIRTYRQELVKMHTEITETIATMSSYTILDRVYMEMSRIMCESYEEALSEFAFEILGNINGISTYKQTFISESINMATSVVQMKFDHMVNNLALLDQEIKGLLEAHVLNGTVVTKQQEDKVYTDIDAISNEAIKIKTELYTTFLGEQEKAHTLHKELNILQKTQVEMHIASVDWLYHFNFTYKSILQKMFHA